jgi:hypothetical protein
MFLVLLLWFQLLQAHTPGCLAIWATVSQEKGAHLFEIDKAFSEKYLIGILVELKDGERVLALSSYSSSRHYNIDQILQKQFPGQLAKVLWGGEIKMQRSLLGNSVFVLANETSSHVGKLFPEQSVEHLTKWLLKNEPSLVSVDFKTEKFDRNNKKLHLNEAENTFIDEFPDGVRHEIQNIDTMILGKAQMIDEGKNPKDPFIQSLLKFSKKTHYKILAHHYRELLVDGYISSEQYQTLNSLIQKAQDPDFKMTYPEYQTWIKLYRDVNKKLETETPTVILRPKP